MRSKGDPLDSLDDLGYVLLRDAISSQTIADLREIFEREATASSHPHPTQTGTRHVELGHEPLVVESCLQTRSLIAIERLFGRKFYITSVHGRDPLPGFGQQGLHIDWPYGFQGSVQVVTSLVFLDDFGPHNGATRVVPGTHRLPYGPDKRTADPARRHPQQIVLEGQAGSSLIFSGHLWHSGTRNLGTKSRRAFQASYTGHESMRRGAKTLPAATKMSDELQQYLLVE
jgi:ectoine hydroxylase-related dioxygenase (phytanoyl-CoA dioxygenase family)